MIRRVLLISLGAVLASGCGEISLEGDAARPWACIPTPADAGGFDAGKQCSGGWSCGFDQKCFQRDAGQAAAAWRCVADDQCPSDWRCGALVNDERFCQRLDAGAPSPCNVFDDCQGGWRCGFEQLCFDPAPRDGGSQRQCDDDRQCPIDFRCGEEVGGTSRCLLLDAGTPAPCNTDRGCEGGFRCDTRAHTCVQLTDTVTPGALTNVRAVLLSPLSNAPAPSHFAATGAVAVNAFNQPGEPGVVFVTLEGTTVRAIAQGFNGSVANHVFRLSRSNPVRQLGVTTEGPFASYDDGVHEQFIFGVDAGQTMGMNESSTFTYERLLPMRPVPEQRLGIVRGATVELDSTTISFSGPVIAATVVGESLYGWTANGALEVHSLEDGGLATFPPPTGPAITPGTPVSVVAGVAGTGMMPPTVRSLFSSCDVTREQTQFTPDGVPVPAADGREGWVWVAPYWAPQTRIKVCAYDAQAHLRGPQTNTDCSTGGGPQAIDCGCGPNLSFCQLTVGYATNKGVPNGPVEIFEATEATLDRAFAEQMLRFTDRIIDTQRPWSDLLLSDETEVNGPIAHYLRWQTGTTAYANLSSRPNLGYVVPSTLEWTQKDTWVRVRSTGKAAGVLTQPAWLLKFATNRARANRFYNAFLCSVFQAPPGGLPSSTEPCAQEPNLARRCGCDSCHQTLEPMAAYWGRFAERGTHELLTPEFPTDDPTCIAPSGSNVNTQRCQTFYVTRARIPAEQPWVGKLKAYAYADDFNGNIDDGPLTLARNAVNTGDFARCTVTKEFERLVGRPFNSQLADERALQDRLTTEFIASNHDLRRLLRRILESRQYRSNDSAGGAP